MRPNYLINKIKLSLFTAALILTVDSFAAAQPKASAAFSSFERAKQVLDAAIAAHGGLENIRRADKIAIDYKSVNFPLGQSYSFVAPLAGIPRGSVKTLIDFGGGRYFTESESNFQGGYKFNFRSVVAPKRSFSIDVLQNRRGNEVRNLSEPQKIVIKIGALSEVPHLLLLYTAQRPETLRSLGESEVDGRRFRVISFAAENGTEMTLYFDAQTNLLIRTEQIGSNPVLGDTTSGSVFSDYQTIGSVKIPRRRSSFLNQYTTGENEYAKVKLEFAADEKMLEIPPGFVEAAASPATPPQATADVEGMRKMGDGVYLIERIGAAYRVMYVEFADYVIILEAPTNADVSKAVIKLVKQTIPNKPIKYVAFSHFHFDHTGGLREYIAEGATVIVPPGNKTFVEQIAQSKFTLRPDTLTLKPRQPVIETFEKKRVFTDGKRTVELYNVSPVSHAAEMAMFYFPKEKILFQGDMFSPLDAGGIPPIIEVHRELAEKVFSLKLDVETLVGVHSGALPWKDFLNAVNDSAKK
ncbi:MAG: MBL fold metallo-hydrolase [Acidobacteriota bacterium]|nr:MBL fold metallo-hydrolase [Acidobacteriota bacterium]